MKDFNVIIGSLIGAAMLTGSAIAAEAGTKALAPTSATAETMVSFVDRYATRESGRAVQATDVVLYPTADREVVFVTFRVGGVDRIGLVEAHGGRVTRFTDFSGARPKRVSTVIAHLGDAQAQAQSILSPPPSMVSVKAARAAPDHQPTGAQEQAAALLRFASGRHASTDSSRISSPTIVRSSGGSYQTARALLSSSSIE